MALRSKLSSYIESPRLTFTIDPAFVSSHVVITWFDARDDRHRRLLSQLASALHPAHVFAVCELPRAESASRPAPFDGPNVTVLEMDVMFGRGAALRAGLAQTREEFVAFVDLDSCIDADTIGRAFASLVATGADGIVYDRFARVDRARRSDPSALRTRAINRIARAAFGIRVRDVRSPLKVFTREALFAIFEGLRLYAHGFDIDLLLNAQKRGMRIVEMGLPDARFEIGRKTASDGFSTVAPLLALRLFHSPLRNVPFADLIAARYALPAKRTYSIAIFCWRDPLSPKAGGGEVYLYEQAKWWVRQGCDVTWAAERYPGSKREETLDGIRIVRRGRGLAVFAAVPFWHLFESDKRYDFIIDVMNGVPFFTPLYSMKPKICLLYHVHAHHFREELPRLAAEFALWIESRLVPFVYRFTRFATISDSTKREMRVLGISRLPIAMIHSGVSDDCVPGRKATAPTILYVGRIRRYKQVRKLLEAFASVKARVPDARLIIAGSGDDLPSLREETRNAGQHDVEFLGRVDEATKIRLMQEAWVFAMPSQLEGWGIVVVEAASCGTPAVAYDVNGLRDCIIDGVTGYLAADDAEFAERLFDVLTDPGVRERMSSEASAWSARFSWERTAARTLETIRIAQLWRAVFAPLDGATWGIRTRNRRAVASLGGLHGNAETSARYATASSDIAG